MKTSKNFKNNRNNNDKYLASNFELYLSPVQEYENTRAINLKNSNSWNKNLKSYLIWIPIQFIVPQNKIKLIITSDLK